MYSEIPFDQVNKTNPEKLCHNEINGHYYRCTTPTIRGVSGGWAGWAIAHPVFGRIEGAAGRRRGSGGPHY